MDRRAGNLAKERVWLPAGGEGGGQGGKSRLGAAGGIERWQKEPLEISNRNRGHSTEDTAERRCPGGAASKSSRRGYSKHTQELVPVLGVIQSEDTITSERHPRPRLTEDHQIGLRGAGWRRT